MVEAPAWLGDTILALIVAATMAALILSHLGGFGGTRLKRRMSGIGAAMQLGLLFGLPTVLLIGGVILVVWDWLAKHGWIN